MGTSFANDLQGTIIVVAYILETCILTALTDSCRYLIFRIPVSSPKKTPKKYSFRVYFLWSHHGNNPVALFVHFFLLGGGFVVKANQMQHSVSYQNGEFFF